MSKNFFTLTTLMVTTTLMGCSQNIDQDSNKYDYSEIKDFEIKYSEVFSFDLPYYFVYYYSLHCLHCELIKDEVISYAKDEHVPMKFIQYYDEVPIKEDVSDTIGLKSLENLGILGTPSLMLIQNGSVALNIAGKELIKSVLNEYK